MCLHITDEAHKEESSGTKDALQNWGWLGEFNPSARIHVTVMFGHLNHFDINVTFLPGLISDTHKNGWFYCISFVFALTCCQRNTVYM
jgi:hypothetical protein